MNWILKEINEKRRESVEIILFQFKNSKRTKILKSFWRHEDNSFIIGKSNNLSNSGYFDAVTWKLYQDDSQFVILNDNSSFPLNIIQKFYFEHVETQKIIHSTQYSEKLPSST